MNQETNQESSASSLRIAYVFATYPSLHKTFVDREILILRKMGVDLSIYTLYEKPLKLSPYQEELKKTITYLHPAARGVVRRANVQMFLRHPGRYLGTLLHLLSFPHPFLSRRLRTIQHFLNGTYLAWLLAQNPPNHIHAHFLNESATDALVASRLLGIPYSVEVHASTELFVGPNQIPQKLAEARFIVTCTRYNQDYLTELDSRLGPKTRVIYHGLDAYKYQRKSLPQPGTPIILGVGQLKERKGFQVLIDACAILAQCGLDFECRIVGEGEMRGVLEQKIQAYGLGNQVKLLGALEQDQVIQQYEQAAIFSLPAVMANDGDRDGIPNVLLEAMAMGLPVVSTRHLAITELVENGVNGLLVPPDNAEALANALQALMRDAPLRERLAQAGRQLVLEKFDPEKNARLLLNTFGETVPM